MCDDWLKALEVAVRKWAQPVVLVAHSLGCALVAHWASRARQTVRRALLVALPDVESHDHCSPEIWNFGPLPLMKFPFPSILIARRNDPYVSFRRAQFFAEQWECQFVDYGKSDHKNADSGLGNWPAGQTYLNKLRRIQ